MYANVRTNVLVIVFSVVELVLVGQKLIFYCQFLFVRRFVTDVEILAKTHVFIGSNSNVYPVVVGLRIARDVSSRHKKLKNQNCVLLAQDPVTNDMYSSPKMFCEGNLICYAEYSRSICTHAG